MRDISCCIWALPGTDVERVERSAAMGFRAIDVRPPTLDDAAVWKHASDLSLALSCVALSAGLPDGASLNTETEAARALPLMARRLPEAARRGARAAYVVPGRQADDLDRYAERLLKLAGRAADAGIRICVEHFPGTCLPTAVETLRFLSRIDHPNLFLLIDSGHLSMSNEPMPGTVRAAGRRLGYVHLDDNDGVRDQHLALTDGVLTDDLLRGLFSALDEIGYEGGISIELNPQLADPADALARSLATAQRLSAGR